MWVGRVGATSRVGKAPRADNGGQLGSPRKAASGGAGVHLCDGCRRKQTINDVLAMPSPIPGTVCLMSTLVNSVVVAFFGGAPATGA